ncbi:MAG: type VI secretion system baseplate subunit TssE [Succinivibrionaceae bacterium]
MQSESLLERVRNLYGDVTPSGSDVDRAVASIVRNLERILNHQQGSALAQPDLGLPDFNASRFGEGLDNLRAMEPIIERCIRRYEPRCTNVRVHFEEDRLGTSLNLAFRVSLSIVFDNKIIPLVFETVLSMDGRIYVEHT